MYCISASPYTKIFLPEWEDQIMEDPNLITDDKVPFHFNVPFTTGAVGMFEFNEIMRLDDLPCVKRRLPEDRKGLFNILTGGTSGLEYRETALWGIVAVNLEMDMTKHTVESMHLQAEAIRSKDEKKVAAIKKKRDDIEKKFQEQYWAAQSSAKKVANEKVFDFIKFTAENLKDQWQKLKEDGKQPYNASTSELGCLFVLKDYLVDKSKKRANLNREASEFIERINSF